MYICIQVYKYVYIYMYIYIYVYIYICVYIYMYVYIYRHAHTSPTHLLAACAGSGEYSVEALPKTRDYLPIPGSLDTLLESSVQGASKSVGFGPLLSEPSHGCTVLSVFHDGMHYCCAAAVAAPSKCDYFCTIAKTQHKLQECHFHQLRTTS